MAFAFTAIVAWSYYGERCAEHLFGMVWLIADIRNALMAIPNLIAQLALSGAIFAVTRAYFEREQAAG
ncbi:MAG: alanine:cation symporter family protein [Halofilum sp. (in: g-proteobacteria)]